MSDDAVCDILLCDAAAVADGPRSGLRVCEQHLQQETQRVQLLKQQMEGRIQGLKDSLELLRPRQEKLTADLEELEQIFDDLEDGVRRWRAELLGGVGGRRESLQSKIAILQHVSGFEQQLSKAEAAGDFRHMYELVTQVEPSVEALSPSGRGARPALLDDSAPEDVCSAVRNAQFLLDRQLAPACGAAPTCRLVRRLRAGAEVECVAVWPDTSGYCVLADGRLAKGVGGRRLSGPAAVVSLDPSEGARHLLLLPLDASDGARCSPDIDWAWRVQALLCDCRRRLLLVAQGNDGVTVCELGGRVLHKVNGNSLGHRLLCARGLAADADCRRVFVLDGDARAVLAVSADAYELEFVVDIAEFFNGRPGAGALAVSGSRLLVADSGGRRLHKFCALTRRHVRSFGSAFQRPAGVAVDSRGLVCLSDSWGQVVRLLLADGTLVATVGVESQSGDDDDHLDGPQGLAILEADGVRQLLVADWRNQVVRVYDLC